MNIYSHNSIYFQLIDELTNIMETTPDEEITDKMKAQYKEVYYMEKAKPNQERPKLYIK